MLAKGEAGLALEIEKLRADTEGCQGDLAHFNNAGASLMPASVVQAVRKHLDLESRIGGYEAAARMQSEFAQIYHDVANLINADHEEIALLNNATEAWNAVFYSMNWAADDEVITTQSEYNSNMISFRHLEKRVGIRVIMAPDHVDGIVDLEALEQLISGQTKLIAISHIPTNEGLVQPAARIGEIAKAHDVPFLLDACQSVGQMPVDVQKIGCTMLSATGRKYLRGPRGTGFLWMRKDWIARTIPYVLDTRSARWDRIDGFTIAPDARRFELWEKNVSGLLGLGAACRYARDIGPEQIWRRIKQSSDDLRARLSALPGITVQDRGAQLSGIVTFCHTDITAQEYVARLRDEFQINTSVTTTQLTRKDLLGQGTYELVRASVHAFNSDAELSRLIKAVETIGEGRTQHRSTREGAAVSLRSETLANGGG